MQIRPALDPLLGLVHAKDGSEVVKLVDFSPIQRRGTAGYQAPEMVRGASSSQPSDLFAFGVVLYEMLLGRLPSVSDGQDPPLPKQRDERGNGRFLGIRLVIGRRPF